MLTSLPPSGLLLFPPKQRVVCFPLVLESQPEIRGLAAAEELTESLDLSLPKRLSARRMPGFQCAPSEENATHGLPERHVLGGQGCTIDQECLEKCHDRFQNAHHAVSIGLLTAPILQETA